MKTIDELRKYLVTKINECEDKINRDDDNNDDMFSEYNEGQSHMAIEILEWLDE